MIALSAYSSRAGLVAALGQGLHLHERGHRLAPVVAERGELPVSFGEQRRRVVTGVRADAFDGEQQPGEGGPGPVADGLEDVQAVQRGGGALLAGVHDAGPGPLHQRHGLHGAGARGR